jgi:hypothetical protein
MKPTRIAAAAINFVTPGSTAIAATNSSEAAAAPPHTDFTRGFVRIRVACPRNTKRECTPINHGFGHFRAPFTQRGRTTDE